MRAFKCAGPKVVGRGAAKGNCSTSAGSEGVATRVDRGSPTEFTFYADANHKAREIGRLPQDGAR